MTSFVPLLANLNIKRNVKSMFVHKKCRYNMSTYCKILKRVAPFTTRTDITSQCLKWNWNLEYRDFKIQQLGFLEKWDQGAGIKDQRPRINFRKKGCFFNL